MNCESIRPVVRTFLDDLLDEKDYQDIQAHLAGCQRCHAYASSVGTLSYGLYELGQVSVPPDTSSAVLYQLERQGHSVSAEPSASMTEEKEPDPAPRSLSLLWVIIFAVLLVSVVAVIAMVSFRRVQKEDRAAVVPSVSLPAARPLEVTDAGSGETKTKEVFIHWHYHVSRSSLSELHQLFQGLSLTVADESQSHIIFYVPKERLGKFTSQMAGLSGVVKEYGEIDPPKVSTGTVQVSLYLE